MKNKIKALSFSEQLASKGLIGKLRFGILLAFVKEECPDKIKSNQKRVPETSLFWQKQQQQQENLLVLMGVLEHFMLGPKVQRCQEYR